MTIYIPSLTIVNIDKFHGRNRPEPRDSIRNITEFVPPFSSQIIKYIFFGV